MTDKGNYQRAEDYTLDHERFTHSTTDLYTYTLDVSDYAYSRRTEKEAAEDFGTDSLQYAECMLARQKSWVNMIATDSPEYCRICEEADKGKLPYETQQSCHEAATNGVTKWLNRIQRIKDRDIKRAQNKKRTGEV